MFGKPSATVIFPNELNSLNPIEVSDPNTSLEAAFLQRYAIESLSSPWKREDLCGVYVLLSDLQFTSRFKVYVGSTSEGFERPLLERNEKSHFWSNAILFSNHDGENLTVEQVRQLEAELVRLLSTGSHIELQNPEESEDAETSSDEQEFIEEMALFVVRIMFLQGYRSGSLARAMHAIESHSESVHPPED